jgi:hypothetical protein
MSKSGLMMGAECANCGCKPCQACDAACDDTPSENFEAVHVSVAGNENLTDGILEASGDTNPVPGYPGGSTGPYEQVISGSATLPGDRFPCYARLQLWRNEADQEPGGSPTMDLDYQYVLITCTVGKIRFGPLELSAGQSVWITSDTTLTPPSPAPTYIFEGTSIPLVGGDGDQSGSPPAYLGGTLAVQALCVDPVDGVAGVSFYAKIAWSEEAAYHVLYGRMVECYDEPASECEIDCDGTPTAVPETLYLTIENAVATTPDPLPAGYSYSLPDINGVYALTSLGTLNPNGLYCDLFFGGEMAGDAFVQIGFGTNGVVASPSDKLFLYFTFPLASPPTSGGYGYIELAKYVDNRADVLCGIAKTGSAEVQVGVIGGLFPGGLGSITFDWELSS